MLAALKGRGGALVDIGSGDGRIVMEAARAGYQAHGVELNRVLVMYSRFLLLLLLLLLLLFSALLYILPSFARAFLILLLLPFRLIALKSGLRGQATFARQDLWRSDMSQYNNVVIFGVEQMMEQLESKLESELVPGSVVVACRCMVLSTVHYVQ